MKFTEPIHTPQRMNPLLQGVSPPFYNIRYLNKTKLIRKRKKLLYCICLPVIYANYLIQCKKGFLLQSIKSGSDERWK